MKKILALTFLTATVAAQAQVISWNIDAYGTITASEHAGVVDAANWNDTWLIDGNALNATESNLKDNTGAATTVSLQQLGHNNSWNFWSIQGSDPGLDANGASNKRLLNGYANKGGTEPSTSPLSDGHTGVSLSGITYSVYDIYVYFSSDTAGRVGTVSLGSTTYDFSTVGSASIAGGSASFVQTTDTTGANPTANYVVFTGLTGSTQTIDSYVNLWGGIAGIQIVAVPEPGTLALVGLGGLATLVMARRSRKK